MATVSLLATAVARALGVATAMLLATIAELRWMPLTEGGAELVCRTPMLCAVLLAWFLLPAVIICKWTGVPGKLVTL